jgi:hypothetical protein
VADPLGLQVVKGDISGYFLKIGADRLDQGQMGLEARAIQVLKYRHIRSLCSPATEGRQEKQNSFAR